MRIATRRGARGLVESIIVLLLVCSWVQGLVCASPVSVSAHPAWLPIIPGFEERKTLMEIRGQPSQGFLLTASLEPPVVPTGGRPILAVALQNVSAESLRAACSDPERFLAVMMEDPSGQLLVPKTGPARSAWLSQRSLMLRPGAMQTWEYQLGEMYELGSPGEYRITVGRRVPPKDEANGRPAYVIANTVTLTVTRAAMPSSPAREAGARLFAHKALSASDVMLVTEMRSLPLDGFQLTSVLPKPRVFPGDTITLTVTLRNVGGETLSFWESGPADFDIRLIVQGPQGIVPPKVEGFGTIEGRVMKIPPGDKVTHTFNINWLYELSAVGEYTITPVRRMIGPNGATYVVSNPVVLTVSPSP